MTIDLFEEQEGEHPNEVGGTDRPLADRVRPASLDEFIGQEHLLGEGKVLRRAIEADDLVSMIFWGPPGSGKTTLARIIARETKSEFHSLSAVTAGVSDVRQVLDRARRNRGRGTRTILFIDEIHRFNKAQQDALLHAVEDGTILLIGATTENPSFEVIGPLLSRCRVFRLLPLSREELRAVVARALQVDPWLASKRVRFEKDALDVLIDLSGGDARVLLNALELAVKLASPREDGTLALDEQLIREAMQRPALLYDKKGDYHYDLISAFIKSVRGSDPDAAIYWMARMLAGGEDPKFIARRLIILASEDVGNADPFALVLATAAFTAVDYVGMPEARIILAQAAAYLAAAPKSNAAYLAISEAMEDVEAEPLADVPLHLRNAPTELMREMGYASGYQYPHDFEGHFVRQAYRPPGKDRVYYRPTEIGAEKRLRDRLIQLWPERYRRE
ncbi:MAG: replication-associated recombination protein A [candidate division KSB1 bacterium]|nr:replication-associated recombination protein A [candidate division KSB1 bacterium]